MPPSRPASPNVPSASMARAARAAASRVSHTTAPFPAASPDAFTTSGAAWVLMYARAGASAVKVRLAAVGTPALRITPLADALDDSMRGAAAPRPDTEIRRAHR